MALEAAQITDGFLAIKADNSGYGVGCLDVHIFLIPEYDLDQEFFGVESAQR
jgi:hypothetical protein